MVKKSKKLIVLLLVAIVAVMFFEYIGVTKPKDINGDTGTSLGAGDWLYLDISQAPKWSADGCITTLWYESTTGWKGVNMPLYDTNLYRVRIPDDIKDGGSFKFFRGLTNVMGEAINWCPNYNLSLSSATSNTFRVTSLDYTNGEWSQTWNKVNNAGETVYFLNMNGTAIDGLKAVFSVSGSSNKEVSMAPESNVMTGLYKVTIPENADYDTVQFIDSSENVLATEKVMGGSYQPNSSNTYYYGVTEKSDGTILSKWSTYPTAESIVGEKLYFDNDFFDVSTEKTITLQVGTGTPVTLGIDSLDRTIYSYTIPNNSGATRSTIITVEMDGNTYRFLWSDASKDTVGQNSGNTDILEINGVYDAPPLSVGDWFYLDVSEHTPWEENNAETWFAYNKGSKEVMMTPCGNHLYRVKITEEMSFDEPIMFRRYNSADHNYLWSTAPSSSISLSSTRVGKVNTYKLTGWNSSAWPTGEDGWIPSNNAGKDMYFMNMGNTPIVSINAVFYVSSSKEDTKTVEMLPVSDTPGLYSVIIPGGDDYDLVKFTDSEGNILATQKIIGGLYEPSGNNTYYYNRTEKSDGNISIWGTYPYRNDSIAGKKLYLDTWGFEVDSEKTITIQVGNGATEIIKVDSNDSNIYSYSIPVESGATQQTIVTINYDGKSYHFLWSDINKDMVLFSSTDILSVDDTYSKSDTGKRKIYFDATLSKLSYVDDVGDVGIPLANSETIHYYAWNSKDASQNGEGTLTKVAARTIGSNTWTDIYMVELEPLYDKILFYSGALTAMDASKTEDLDIPDIDEMEYPCFYADSSDNAVYTDEAKRSGYWKDVYTVRDVQKYKGSDIVNVETEAFNKDSTTLYINTTLYDYYTDYELNGLNRDGYTGAEDDNTHRIYQPFRQFNQALSEYYKKHGTTSTLYWGHIQRSGAISFSNIAGTLNLYGYNNYSKFVYENNSTATLRGGTCDADNATINLTSDKLSSGSLMLDTDDENTTVPAPFFDEDFLTGNNSKNTVLGEIYKNVAFPFVKKEIEIEGKAVDYWYYNSADTTADNKNLQLRKASDTDNPKYYLASIENENVKGYTNGDATEDNNYFPFNALSESGDPTKLNYGFAQKLEFTFRLTENGTVKANDGIADVPIMFQFDGDDDVWVFIDGELILDIGGGHGKVEGTINFADRKSTVSGVKDVGTMTTSFPDTMKDDEFYKEEHTLTMYYMERGLWESNMKIVFNFPDENKLSVEKEVDTSNVNALFKDLFDDMSMFRFNIRNQATHYGTVTVVKDGEASPETFNDDFTGNTIEPLESPKKFQYENTYVNQTNVVHWYVLYEDLNGENTNDRWGIIYPEDGKDSYKDVSKQNVYFQFKVYYPYSDTAQLSHMRIQLEDDKGHTIGGTLNGKTYGNSSITSNEWTRLQIDLRKFDGYEGFNFAKVANVKFAYDYPRDIYLDDFVFKPAVNATALVGFTTQQYDIPDYGSATSGKLENAVDALYSTKLNDGSIEYGRVDEDGIFVLADGQKITFSNQFRRGSYIYLKEEVNEDVFDVSWKLYEGDIEVTDSTPPPSSKVVNGGKKLTTDGTTISDGRKEVYTTDEDDGHAQNNVGYGKTGPAQIEIKGDTEGTSETVETEDTIVFRSYEFPDSVVVGIDLTIKQINTVKTGALTISKEEADGLKLLKDKEFTFNIVFSNVAGLGLESEKIVHTITLKAGESETIEGIPAGTIYTITEVIEPSSDIKLESITQKKDGDNVIGNDLVLITGTTMAQGQIVADENITTATGFVFTNSFTPTINLNLKKLWVTNDGTTPVTEGLPESIWVQVQRKTESETVFTPVDVPGSTSGCIEIVPGYDGWVKQVVGLNKYKDNAKQKDPYIYRVVEMQKQDNGEFTEVDGTFWYAGSEFEVSYSENIDLTVDNTSKEYDYNITNKNLELFNFSFTKITGSGDSISTVLGAEFTLYEYEGGDVLNTYADIMNAIDEIQTDSTLWKEYELTDIDSDSIYSQEGLSRKSVYYLVESRVPTGMQSPNGCWKIEFVTDSSTGEYVHDNVKITPIPLSTISDMPAIGYLETATNNIEGWFITNLEQWDIPETGGNGFTYPYMVGICLMLIAVVWGGTLYYRDRRQKRT